jgi:hypothetical protein
MRPLLPLLCSAALLGALALPGCKRETQEAVAEAKGAAEQAKRDAERAKRTAEEAAVRAQMAAADAHALVSELGQSIQQSMKEAGDQARAGVGAAAQSIRELGAGDVVVGTLAESTASQVTIRLAQQQTLPLATDAQTRWIVKGAAGAQAGIPTGSFVRVTYIVRDGQKVATQVETLAH